MRGAGRLQPCQGASLHEAWGCASRAVASRDSETGLRHSRDTEEVHSDTSSLSEFEPLGQSRSLRLPRPFLWRESLMGSVTPEVDVAGN